MSETRSLANGRQRRVDTYLKRRLAQAASWRG
jgi:hypothetical protein